MSTKTTTIVFLLSITWHCHGCSSSCRGNGDDANDTYDAVDGSHEDLWDTHIEDDPPYSDVYPDTLDAIETDPDALDVEPTDCFLPFDGESYDLDGLDIELKPRDRSPTYCGPCCKQVSFSDDRLAYPDSFDVWGSYLVYSTFGGSPGSERTRIVLCNLAGGDEYLINETIGDSTTNELVYFPTIFGGELYYSRGYDTSDSDGTCEIMHFSLSDGSFARIHDFASRSTTFGGWCSSGLDAYGDFLVWDDARLGSMNQQVRVLDITTGVETTVSDYIVGHTNIWDGIAVYQDYSSGPMKVKVYDVNTGSLEDVVAGLHDTWYPSIWEDIVTWSDARAGGNYADMRLSDIYMKDLATGVETPVCTHPASQFGSWIHGDLVVWTDLRDDPDYPNVYTLAENWNVYGYWISTGTEFRITNLPGREWVFRVFDNHVFFNMRDEAGVDSIFMIDVPPP